MAKQDSIEAFFFKAMGWKKITTRFHKVVIAITWQDPQGNKHKDLPDIIDHYPSFKKHVKDNEITWAAVVAATRYLEAKDD